MTRTTMAAETPTSDASKVDSWLSPASWWMPRHLVESAWQEHAPFAAWIVDVLRPTAIAELGTHNGLSYFAFCEAVSRLHLSTRTFAMDSWEGDDQAGFYGDEVYESVAAINEAEYAEFSTLLRGYFDDSLPRIADGSIDLLHIDGRHGYDDVRHDFEAWLPKMSERGVVLFHDTAEFQEGFGVWQFWAEISSKYPSFEFAHGHGLGVLGVGANIPAAMTEFFEVAQTSGPEIRKTYEDLGAGVSLQYRNQLALAELESTRTALGLAEHRVRELTEQQARDANEIEGLRGAVADYQGSTSWRVTSPLRKASDLLHRR